MYECLFSALSLKGLLSQALASPVYPSPRQGSCKCHFCCAETNPDDTQTSDGELIFKERVLYAVTKSRQLA